MTLPEALRYQARSCTALGSPFMGRMLSLLADNWPEGSALARAAAEIPGDPGPNGASLPLRIAGGLHALVLMGRDQALQAVYPPNDPSDQALIGAVLRAIEAEAAFLTDWIRNAPQTNEVRRSVALIPAAHWIAARYPLPFVTSELGASAGLNLIWDRYALETAAGRLGTEDPVLTLRPEWSGNFPAAAPVRVAERAGVDLNPLDVGDEAQALRVLSYLWPDQPERRELTQAAIAARPGPVVRADAIDWLESRLATPPDGHLHLIYHTIAWQYFPPESQARGQKLIEEAGAKATADRPLAWLSMEHDGDSASLGGAALTLRLWPGNESVKLARVHFHGGWVRWLV